MQFVSMKGVLVKSGGSGIMGPNFRKRWFELEASTLSYYESEAARGKGKPAKGLVELTADTKLSKEAGEEACKFQVMTAERVFILIAADPAEALRWLEALKTNIGVVRAQAGGAAAAIAGPPGRQGEMWKKGHVRRNWTKRYFVLSHGQLKYMEGSAVGVERGAVALTSGPCILTVRPSWLQKTGASDSSEWRFELRTPNGTIVCAAMDEADMDAWVAAIRGVCAHYEAAAAAGGGASRGGAAAGAGGGGGSGQGGGSSGRKASRAMIEMVEAAQAAAASGSGGKVVDQIEELVDEGTGRKYWYNKTTGQTAWSREGLTPAMQSISLGGAAGGGGTSTREV